jgi:hypothetical protein
VRADRLVAAAFAVALLAPAAARAECSQEELARVDARLAGEARKARRWNFGWMIGYGALTAGQLGLVAAEWVPGQEYTDVKEKALLLGAAKSGIGALARVVLPLRIHGRFRTSEPVDECGYAEKALEDAYLEERNSFVLNLAGGVLLNVAGLVILGTVYDDWTEGWVSFGLGLPVALLANLTHPRGAWRNRSEWTIAVEPRGVSLATSW